MNYETPFEMGYSDASKSRHSGHTNAYVLVERDMTNASEQARQVYNHGVAMFFIDKHHALNKDKDKNNV